MTACARQGDILWLEKEKQYVLVLSRGGFQLRLRDGMQLHEDVVVEAVVAVQER